MCLVPPPYPTRSKKNKIGINCSHRSRFFFLSNGSNTITTVPVSSSFRRRACSAIRYLRCSASSAASSSSAAALPLQLLAPAAARPAQPDLKEQKMTPVLLRCFFHRCYSAEHHRKRTKSNTKTSNKVQIEKSAILIDQRFYAEKISKAEGGAYLHTNFVTDQYMVLGIHDTRGQ
ncbi:hypothetical protein LXL04_023191 [Taraxacum kok-saghyz]